MTRNERDYKRNNGYGKRVSKNRCNFPEFSLLILVVKSRFKTDPWYKNYLSKGKVGKKYFK